MRPSHVRLFWWLSVALVVYWLVTTGKVLLFPTEHYYPWMRKMSPSDLAMMRRGEASLRCQWAIARLVISFVTLSLARFAAFHRQNWARWALALLFLFLELLPYFGMTYVIIRSGAPSRIQILWPLLRKSLLDDLSHPLIPALTIAAIVAVFTGNANDWFRRPAAGGPST